MINRCSYSESAKLWRPLLPRQDHSSIQGMFSGPALRKVLTKFCIESLPMSAGIILATNPKKLSRLEITFRY
jgi:hypothetical protein